MLVAFFLLTLSFFFSCYEQPLYIRKNFFLLLKNIKALMLKLYIIYEYIGQLKPQFRDCFLHIHHLSVLKRYFLSFHSFLYFATLILFHADVSKSSHDVPLLPCLVKLFYKATSLSKLHLVNSFSTVSKVLLYTKDPMGRFSHISQVVVMLYFDYAVARHLCSAWPNCSSP
jgi:hypothetical protein